MPIRKAPPTSHFWLTVWVVLIAGLAVSCLAASRQTSLLVQTHQPGLYRVTKFVDGDTIVVDMQGRPETIRFIGVDTPETHKPNTPVQCYGPVAANHTKQLIGPHKVRLESDRLSTNRDRYDRLLRYVYLADGTLVNENLIAHGYGFYYPYFPYTKSDRFRTAQSRARHSLSGLWSRCHPEPRGAGFVSNVAV